MKSFIVEYIRDGLTEEFHNGFYSISSKNYKNKQIIPYYLRSCAKPLQATLLIDYHIDLTPQELAFCCGSHAGENIHIKIGLELLKKIDLKEENLKCGIHEPLSKTMQNQMLLEGKKASQIHNNCSGKHIGFLAICKKKNWDLSSYDSPEHPLQIEIKNKINNLCNVNESSKYPMTTDGCGVPILSMPLKNLADGYVNLLNYPEIINAIKENPYIFGGEDRLDTEIIQQNENLIAKVGAGGLCVVLNIKTREAFALKVNDCSMEARKYAVAELINGLDWGNIDLDKNIKTISGKIVGEIVTTFS